MLNLVEAFFSNTVVAFVVLVGFIVFFHEMGHFLCAKLMGIAVEEFCIGMGPKIFSFSKGGTEYKLAWLPLGGYVRFYGSYQEQLPLDKQKIALSHATVSKRALISAGGPLANFILSFLILFALNLSGRQYIEPIIQVLPNSVAQHSGLQTQDKVIAIECISQKELSPQVYKITEWQEIGDVVSKSLGQPLVFSIIRESKYLKIKVIPEQLSSSSGGRIGVSPFSMEPKTRSIHSVEELFSLTAKEFWLQMTLIVDGLKKLCLGQLPLSDLGGPIAIASVAGMAAKAGVIAFLNIMSLLSVNIGLFNLLPLPMLDGGALLLCLVEGVSGKRLSPRFQMTFQKIGVFFFITLICVVFFNDIVKIFFHQ